MHSPLPVADVFLAFLKLGLTLFGGPVAHLGYIRAEFVERRRWLGEAAFADILALCQFLPGPASSQMGITLGLLRAGLPGALAAWTGFTMPSAFALILFARVVTGQEKLGQTAWLHGLKIVAVAVVAQAVWQMATNLCRDRARITLAAAAALLVLFVPSASGQLAAIGLGGLIGWRWLAAGPGQSSVPLAVPFGRGLSSAALIAFFVLLAGLPVLAAHIDNHVIALFDSFYRSGAFGVWWRPCGAAAVAEGGGAAGLDRERSVSCWLRSSTSRAGTALHLCRLPRRHNDAPAERLARGPALPRCDLSALLSAAHRDFAFLGNTEAATGLAVGA
jgi:chromate transport protein ChrA